MQEVDAHKESGHTPWSTGPSAIMWRDMVEVRAEICHRRGNAVMLPHGRRS